MGEAWRQAVDDGEKLLDLDDYILCRSDRSSKVLSDAESVCWFEKIALYDTTEVTTNLVVGF